MTPNSYKLIKLNGFIPIPPDKQFTIFLFVLVLITVIAVLKEIL